MVQAYTDIPDLSITNLTSPSSAHPLLEKERVFVLMHIFQLPSPFNIEGSGVRPDENRLQLSFSAIPTKI
jgi:hypothetical protein